MERPAPTSASPTAAGPTQNVERGMVLMTLAMLLVPVMDAIAKGLTAGIAPGQVTWGRFVFQTLILVPVLMVASRRNRGTLAWPPLSLTRLAPHAARGTLIAAASFCFFWALKYLPLADAIAIFFVEPLLLTLFSALFLGEPIGWRRVSAIVVGFVGALVVIQPSWQVFGLPALLPLGAATFLAGYLTLTRSLALRESPLTMQLLAGLFGAAVLSVALVVGALGDVSFLAPVWPDARTWALMAAMGLISAVGHVMIVFAFRQAEASVLAPFQYLEIISATLLGLVFFGDFPEASTWLGTAIIVASGLYVFRRERRLARRAAAAAPLAQP